MNLHTTVRDSIPDDAELIFDLRSDPRLRSMQYAPSILETPQSLFAVVSPGPEIPKQGLLCSTILMNEEFAGHIFQHCTTGSSGITNICLGWNLVPELWGMGIMVHAIELLFDCRFKATRDIEFVVCCFASNQRCIRVIEKLGFQSDRLTFFERLFHFRQTWGRERILKYRLTYNMWQQHHATRLAKGNGKLISPTKRNSKS